MKLVNSEKTLKIFCYLSFVTGETYFVKTVSEFEN